MKSVLSLIVAAFAFALVVGCAKEADPGPLAIPTPHDATEPSKPTADEAAKIEKSFSQLSPEDRSLAEAQQYCAVESENRLGLMGKPIKLMVNDKPVFICCKGCRTTALAEPDKTLAKVQELKQKAAEQGSH